MAVMFSPFLVSAFWFLKEITMHRRNTRKLTLRIIASSKIAVSIFFGFLFSIFCFCSCGGWFWILFMELWVFELQGQLFVERRLQVRCEKFKMAGK